MPKSRGKSFGHAPEKQHIIAPKLVMSHFAKNVLFFKWKDLELDIIYRKTNFTHCRLKKRWGFKKSAQVYLK